MKARRLVAVAAAFSLLLAGCSGGGEEPGTEGGGDRTVRLSLSQDVESLLPMDSDVGDNIGVLDVVYSGLVRYDPETTEPHNYIAEDVSTDDNTTWTIKIKDGFTFQNGEKVDAESFARSWNYSAYGPNAMANNYFFERFTGYEEMQGEYEEDDAGKVTVNEEPTAKELSGLKVVDPLTLTVKLNGPFVGFSTMLGYTGFYPVAQACIDDVKACATKPIGNGPFEVDEWEQGQGLKAHKWADYKGEESPDYDKLEWIEYKGSSSWPDFEAGDVDFGSPPPAEWEKANNNPEFTERKVERQGSALTYLGFPLYLGKPWDNIEFRKAISMAINREAIIEQVLPGQAIPADSWVPAEGIPGGEGATCEWCKFDPAAAKVALAKAGGWPKDQVLTISLGQDDTQEEYFRAIGDQISLNLGIKYELAPSADFFAQRSARAFKGPFRNNWFPDYPLNENFLAPPYASGDAKKGNTSFGYYNKAFEDQIDKGDKADTLDAAAQEYLGAEKILAKDFPTIPLSFARSVTFYSDNVDNVVLDPFSGATKLRLLKYVG